MNYVLEEFRTERYDATSKARRDVNYFVYNKLGFKPVAKLRGDKTTIGLYLDIIWSFIKIFLLRSSDTLLVQCPLELLPSILRIKKMRNFKIIYLIHDVFFIKYSVCHIPNHVKEIQKFKVLLESCDEVIAHNDIMISKLESLGIHCNFHNLQIFDYFTKCPLKERTYSMGQKPTVAFAGALIRNPFLHKIDIQNHSYDLIVYGSPDLNFKNIIYKGSVDANLLPEVIEGHFGLLWADDYEQKEIDNYMMYNNPHKLSLYIVAGMPIITWSKYAAAKFISDNKIGCCIDSLDQLDDVIGNITPDYYQEMVNNCKKIRFQLVNGENLKRAIEECL